MWFGNVFSGDLGFFLKYQENVLLLFQKYVWNLFFVVFLVLFIIWFVVMIMGVIFVVRKYLWFDGIVMFFVFVFMVFLFFFISFLFIKWFGVDLKILFVGGMIDIGSMSFGFFYVFEVVRYMIFLVVILFMFGIGLLIRYFCFGMFDVIRQDYIRMVWVKGLKECIVIWKYVLKNVFILVVILFVFELLGLFFGVIIIEQIFGWLGVGCIQLEFVYYWDYLVLMVFILFLFCLMIVGNFLVDIVYVVIDL